MKTLINTLKLLTLAINDLNKSVNELNDSLQNQQPKYKKNLTETYSSSYFSEKQVIDRVCKAFTEGTDPALHKKLSARLKKDWPNLYSALYSLSIFKMNSKSSTTVSYDSFKNYDK